MTTRHETVKQYSEMRYCCGCASCRLQYLTLPPSPAARPGPAPPAALWRVLGVPTLLPCGVCWPHLAGEGPTGSSVLPSAPITAARSGCYLQGIDTEDEIQASTVLDELSPGNCSGTSNYLWHRLALLGADTHNAEEVGNTCQSPVHCQPLSGGSATCCRCVKARLPELCPDDRDPSMLSTKGLPSSSRHCDICTAPHHP